VGLVQTTPLYADLDMTVDRLGRLIPFTASHLSRLAREMDRLGCRLIMCDIAPMGIAVARKAGVPSVLVENFTWDWVYEEYADRHKALRPYADYFKNLFDCADYHIQTLPFCGPRAGNLTVQPVSRAPRRTREAVRQELGIPDSAGMVLITMGGIPQSYDGILRPSHRDDIYVVIPGGSHVLKKNERLITLPHGSAFFHPDLIQASDAVIGKVGYSTVAEVYRSGIPFGFVKRPHFRESEVLSAFIERHMRGFRIEERDLERGKWVASVPRLTGMGRMHRTEANGADQIARFLRELM